MSPWKKLRRIDIRNAAYILFAERRAEALSLIIGITGLGFAFFEAKGTVTSIVLIVLIFGILFYVAWAAPDLRWHILEQSIEIRFLDATGKKIQYVETSVLKSLKNNNSRIRFPVSYNGKHQVVSAKELRRGNEAADLRFSVNKQDWDLSLGCVYVNEETTSDSTIFVKFSKILNFGQTTQVEITRLLENAKEDSQWYRPSTLVDKIKFIIDFHPDRPAAGIYTYKEYLLERDISERNLRRERINDEPDGINYERETFEFNKPIFQHNYGVSWNLMPRKNRWRS
ncbi:hypothetical protein PN498_27690 [Oscillatoria sp. CS-180]|uniref:hypothetical protein n=1 Tax=Oscillatoria sp. CS-180 TaxID=3021720 RepID=UPI0023307233|nr:hypothetical protein [Oscillatoria sp. CS-180]MDB9529801.1 hypothetical protein [Oscillatoria sp. CS-180]